MRLSERLREERFLLAANALLLIRLIFLDKMRFKQKEELGSILEIDGKDYDSFSRLYNILTGTGLMDHRIESVIDQRLRPVAETMPPQIDPNEDVAKIAFRDVPFSPEQQTAIEASNGGSLSGVEWMMPVLAWQPGDVVNTARAVAREFFEQLHTSQGVPTYGAEIEKATDSKVRREAKAAEILHLIQRRQPRKPKQQDVLAVLSEVLGSKAAAERAWGQSVIPDWKKQGRRKDRDLLSKREFESEFLIEFQKNPP